MKSVIFTKTISILMFILIATAPAGFSRTIVVALDGSGDFTRIRPATEVAAAGDSILVRDGDYYDESFTVDSAVVVFAENHGAARIWSGPDTPAMVVIEMHGSAELIGFPIIGEYIALYQLLVDIVGGPAVINNCEFVPAARIGGHQLGILANGHPPIIRNCRFYFSGSHPIAENYDSTDIWMPHNYYGSSDTTMIHLFIWDGQNDPELGFITISPVADTFEWLAVDPRSPIVQERRIELYPNPSHGTISINLNRMMNIQQIDVFNILGQRVWTSPEVRNPQANTLKFNLPLPSGSYFISVHEPKKYHTARLTIIR